MTSQFPSRFVFLRHGQTDSNLNRIVQGQLDIPLNDTGRAQAAAVRDALGSGAFDRLVVSDLSRAVETARIATEGLDLEPIYDARLRERHFGPFQGLPRSRDLWVPPDDDYERIADFVARIAAVLADHADAALPLFIGHGGYLRGFEIAAGVKLPAMAFDNAVPLLVTHADRSGWSCTRLGGAA